MTDEKKFGESNDMPAELAREIARQGEARLTALTSLGTAADHRASTLCGIFGAAAIVTGAAVLANIASSHPSLALVVGGAIGSIGLFIAACVAGNAGAPRDFYIAGGNPDALREWSWDAGKWRGEVEMLDATAQRYAGSIAANRAFLERGSKRVRASLYFASASPVLGLIAFIVIFVLARG